MEHKPNLQADVHYHIFNRGNDSNLLFIHMDDFRRFIDLMQIFLCPVTDVLSYALLRNHFHFVLRIKTDDEIGWLIAEHMYSRDMTLKWSTTFDLALEKQPSSVKPIPTKMIGHLLSTYAKWFNKKYERTGRRFEERFERRKIKTNDYLGRAIAYVNRNPIKHGIVSKLDDYPWISYHALVGSDKTWIAKDRAIQCFGDYETFLLAMQQVDFDDWMNEK